MAAVTHDDEAIYRLARRPLHIEKLCSDRWVLVCAEHAPWFGKVRRLSREGVAPADLVGLPLILPESDAGLRAGIDKVLRKHRLLDKLDIVLELGGWPAIYAYARAGAGVGLVSEAVLGDEKGMMVRYLDDKEFRPQDTKLICRRQGGTGQARDLTDHAADFREALLQAAKERPR